jgi:rhamnosyltransferase
MNIAAVVILYHPDQNAVENILTYTSFINKLYIADNSETPARFVIDKIQNQVAETEYIHDGENSGIAKRLNQVCKMSITEGYEYLLTMDQDSSFEQTMIENYFRCFNHSPGKEKVAMFGVQYENPDWASATCNPVSWTTLITSGSIVNLSLFEEIGGFDEQLFIDTVDFEYCFRSIQKGFRNILFKNILLTHRLGTKKLKHAAGKKKNLSYSIHSPVRLYYMLRNYMYLRAIYKNSFPTEMLQSRNAVFNRVKINLLHDSDKLSIVKFLLRALIDFKRNRMGKYR